MKKFLSILIAALGIVAPVTFVLFLDAIGIQIVWNTGSYLASFFEIIRAPFFFVFVLLNGTYVAFIIRVYSNERAQGKWLQRALLVELILITVALVLIGVQIDSEVFITTVFVALFHWTLFILHKISFASLRPWRYRVGVIVGLFGIACFFLSWAISIQRTQSLCWQNDATCIGTHAGLQNNVTLCAQQSRTYDCYDAAAIAAKDVRICENIPLTSDSRDACYLWYGIRVQDPSACALMRGWNKDLWKDESMWQIKCCKGAFGLDEYHSTLTESQKNTCGIHYPVKD